LDQGHVCLGCPNWSQARKSVGVFCSDKRPTPRWIGQPAGGCSRTTLGWYWEWEACNRTWPWRPLGGADEQVLGDDGTRQGPAASCFEAGRVRDPGHAGIPAMILCWPRLAGPSLRARLWGMETKRERGGGGRGMRGRRVAEWQCGSVWPRVCEATEATPTQHRLGPAQSAQWRAAAVPTSRQLMSLTQEGDSLGNGARRLCRMEAPGCHQSARRIVL
jgi:hypothetical protein